MTSSVLGSVSLGYQFLWNHLRQPAAVELFVDADTAIPVDARHLLAVLRELWPEQAPQLLLSVQSPALFLDLLAQGTPHSPWVIIPQDWLQDPLVGDGVAQAFVRGLKMIWRGPNEQRPDPDEIPFFYKGMLTLSPQESLEGVQALQQEERDFSFYSELQSPVGPGQIYEAVASQLLAQHCLDQQGAWALAGWPIEDVLYNHRTTPMQPGRRAIGRLLEHIAADAAIDVLEQALNDEPVLAYRFLLHMNSPELRARREIETIRHGLMLLGMQAFKTWLLEQLPDTGNDPDMEPVRAGIVTRARLMEKLLDAGDEGDLRREVYWCGLLSQLDLLLGEPLSEIVQKIPVSERVRNALLHDMGPYAPYLAIAKSLESAHTRATHQLCALHDIDITEINRAFLRTLAGLATQFAKN